MRIGIFGGCFNPPHQMHKNIALNLIKNNYLDKVIYVPTGDNYQKKDLISFKYRYNMVKLMISDNKNLLVSDIGNDDNYQYTYQTLNHFKEIYNNDEIYFICGTDNLKEFSTWKNYKYILENYKLLVIKRNDDNIDKILNEIKDFKNNIIVANIELNNISSTKIRKMINENNKDFIKEIDYNVYLYINKFNIYNKIS